MRPPTLDQVADLAGVSRATASRAVNGGHRVSDDAQRAVDRAVAVLGYAPNHAARSLVTKRTGSVALVVAGADDTIAMDPFFANVVRGAAKVFDEHDMQMVLLFGAAGALASKTLRYLTQRHVDGALIFYGYEDDGLAAQVAKLELPCVFGGRPWGQAAATSFVDVDNVAGSRAATNILIERGCRRMATIAGPVNSSAAEDRLAGWSQALIAAGLPAGEVTRGDFTRAGGQEAARKLLHIWPDLDGLVVASDLMAVGALDELQRQGLAVPHDVAVVGFDDLGIAAAAVPPLTSVRQPAREMSESAARLLIQRMAGSPSDSVVHALLSPAVVRRASA